MLINGARYEREETCVTSPKKSHKVCTVYCHVVRPRWLNFGDEKNICAVLYCSACESGARSNP